MEVRQYAQRCITKGQYISDVQKINNITSRMLKIITERSSYSSDNAIEEHGVKRMVKK
jgi:hypothetical protein